MVCQFIDLPVDATGRIGSGAFHVRKISSSPTLGRPLRLCSPNALNLENGHHLVIPDKCPVEVDPSSAAPSVSDCHVDTIRSDISDILVQLHKLQIQVTAAGQPRMARRLRAAEISLAGCLENYPDTLGSALNDVSNFSETVS